MFSNIFECTEIVITINTNTQYFTWGNWLVPDHKYINVKLQVAKKEPNQNELAKVLQKIMSKYNDIIYLPQKITNLQ